MPWHWTQRVRCRSAAFVVACGDANHNYLPSQGVWSGRNAIAFSYITNTTSSLFSPSSTSSCGIVFGSWTGASWGTTTRSRLLGSGGLEVGQTALRLLARWRLQREWQFVNIFSRMPSSFSPQSYWWTTSIGRSSCTPTSSAWYRT